MEKIPTLEVYMYTKRMWGTYRCFNKLQQSSLPHFPVSQDERYKFSKIHRIIFNYSTWIYLNIHKRIDALFFAVLV